MYQSKNLYLLLFNIWMLLITWYAMMIIIIHNYTIYNYSCKKYLIQTLNINKRKELYKYVYAL